MLYDPYRALYIHIPFCVKRCSYCDFDTEAISSQSSKIDVYIDNLISRLHHEAAAGKLNAIETVYVGGGTPSYIGIARLSALFDALSQTVSTYDHVECSMEANPESLTEHMVSVLRSKGVNRLSLGVQSFDDKVLRTLGRAHSAYDARRALTVARTCFNNVSIDLMCGVMGQSRRSLEKSIHEALNLGVSHISIYPLTVEPDTALDQAVREGKMNEPDDDVQALHMLTAANILENAGFKRYEVASYACCGFACRHNSAYWSGVPYLGLGRGATSMLQSECERIRVKNGQIVDCLDERQMAAEDLMLGMRMTRGVDDEQVQHATTLLPDTSKTLFRLEDRGLVIHKNGRWRPTERGWLCGNELYGALLDLAP